MNKNIENVKKFVKKMWENEEIDGIYMLSECSDWGLKLKRNFKDDYAGFENYFVEKAKEEMKTLKLKKFLTDWISYSCVNDTKVGVIVFDK